MTEAVAALCLTVPLAATALCAAATVAVRPWPSFVLVAWLAGITEVVALPLALSPLGAVDRSGYAVTEVVLLAAAAVAWHRAGRPVPPVPDIRPMRDHPILLLLIAGVAASLAYELVLCLTVAPNTWDGLTYHLSRAASWYQHHRVGWIHDAPTERQNVFPANAELAVLWTFVAIHSDRLAALPQFFAGLVAVVAAYGIGVRLGFRRANAAFAALLFATFALVVLESTTTQNDLVVVSLVGTCAYFLLGVTPRAGACAGLAFALAVGTKLTAAPVVPALVVLAITVRVPRRTAAVAALVAAVGFGLLGSWLYVQNVAETGHLLGHGGSRVQHSPALSAVGWLATVVRVLYRFADFSGVAGVGPGYLGPVCAVAVAVVLAGVLAVVDARRRGSGPSVRDLGIAMSFPAVWPVVVLGAATVVYVVLHGLRFPIDPSGTSETVFSWHPSTVANEDTSYLGPLGAILLVVVARFSRPRVWRSWPSAAALALSLPVFLAGVAAVYRFNAFVGRFMLVPVGLTAALLAVLYDRRAIAAGVSALALGVVLLAQLNNQLKPVNDVPWSLSRAGAIGLQAWQPRIGDGVAALRRTVASDGCVGAALGVDDAAFPLFGPHLRRRVSYVAGPGLSGARQNAVIIGPGRPSLRPGPGWRISSLGGYWRLAVREGVARPFRCTS